MKKHEVLNFIEIKSRKFRDIYLQMEKNSQFIDDDIFSFYNWHQTVLNVLKTSENFFIDTPNDNILNVSKYMGKKFVSQNLFINQNKVKLPYKCCYFEWKMKDSEGIVFTSVIMYHQVSENMIQIFSIVKVEKEWNVFKGFILIKLDGTKIVDEDIVNLKAHFPIFEPVGRTKDMNVLVFRQKNYSQVYGEDTYLITAMGVLNNFIKFLNCKNISTFTIAPQIRKLKKNKKRIHIPEKYKILIINPISKKHINQEKQGLWNNKLHTCMGHFKTFTEEKPLFGKYIGTYWWQDIVRGDSTQGSIKKDYMLLKE